MLKSNCFFLLILLLLNTLSCEAYELILPREKNSTVTTNYALFMGKVKNTESLTINHERIFTAPNGAFVHTIKLKNGENRVLIQSNLNTQIYKLVKKTKLNNQADEICDFPTRTFSVKNDNTPLRSTPIDAGLNRIAHLFKETTVLINGSKGDFFRVYLSKDKIAWIAKKDVEEICTDESQTANFINMDSKKYKNAIVQTIAFSKNLPYTVEDSDKEILFRIYNPEYADNSIYTLNIPKPDKYYYSINLENGVYTFKVSEVPFELADTIIAVDAGHGGAEKGAIGCLGDNEKDINLKIALELQKQLEAKGATVVMTRECDGTVSLNDRVAIAKENNADIFISIHLNSIGDVAINPHKHKGTSVYYFNKNSKELAEILEKSITKSAGTRNDGVRTASFAVIRPTHYVGVLVETAYMINPSDSVLYTSEDFASNAAKGIADGIEEFIINR